MIKCGGKRKNFLVLTKYLCSVERKSQRLLDRKKAKWLFWGGMCEGVYFQTKLQIIQLIIPEMSVHFTLHVLLHISFSI